MHATETMAADRPFKTPAQVLPTSLPQTEPAKTAEPPLLLAALMRWKLVKKNSAIALSTLLGHKEIH